LLGAGLRAPTFLVSAIDWDEGLYVLIASQWLGGHPPYTTVFEIKPIGIFAIFAAALGVLGDSIVSIRFITVAVVFLTSVVLLLLAKRLFRTDVAGSWRRSASRSSPWDSRACRRTPNSSSFFSTRSGFCSLSFRLRIPNWTAEKRCSTRSPPA